MLTMMGACLTKVKSTQEDTEEDEGIKDLIEMTLKKMDHDKDGRISFSDFQLSVSREPLLLEAFGTCLPSSRAGAEFMERVLDRQAEDRNGYYYF